jgi:hypothetical protein
VFSVFPLLQASFSIASCAMLPILEPSLPLRRSCHHSVDAVDVWTALSISRICPPNLEKSCFSEHWPLYRVLTLLLGVMLDVERYGPHGGKPGLECQGSYIWSTRTKQHLRFDRHFSWNSNTNCTLWHDSYRMFHVRSWQWVETNISRRPFRHRILFLYLSNTRYQLLFTSMYPCTEEKKQTSSDRLTANRGTVVITSNL